MPGDFQRKEVRYIYDCDACPFSEHRKNGMTYCHLQKNYLGLVDCTLENIETTEYMIVKK